MVVHLVPRKGIFEITTKGGESGFTSICVRQNLRIRRQTIEAVKAWCRLDDEKQTELILSLAGCYAVPYNLIASIFSKQRMVTDESKIEQGVFSIILDDSRMLTLSTEYRDNERFLVAKFHLYKLGFNDGTFYPPEENQEDSAYLGSIHSILNDAPLHQPNS